MTPEKALTTLRDIQARQEDPALRTGEHENTDEHRDHQEADEVLLELLDQMGLSEIVAAFREISKWYS